VPHQRNYFSSVFVILAFIVYPFAANPKSLPTDNGIIQKDVVYNGRTAAPVISRALVAQKLEPQILSKEKKSIDLSKNRKDDKKTPELVLDSKYTQQLQSDTATAFIAQEKDENIFIFFNEKGNPSNGIRGLDGKYLFKNSTASFCRLKPINLGENLEDHLSLLLSGIGILHMKNEGVCPDDLNGIDLFIFQKSHLGLIKQEGFESIQKLIKSKGLMLITVFDVAKLKKNLEKQIAASGKLIKEIISNNAVGFGIAITSITGQGVCTDNGIDQKVSKIILQRFKEKDPVGLKTLNSSKLRNLSAPDIFLNVKKKDNCKYILAGSQSLGALIKGFNRDSVKFSLHHHWIKNTDEEIGKILTKSKKEAKDKVLSEESTKRALEEIKARLLEKEEEFELLKTRRQSAKW